MLIGMSVLLRTFEVTLRSFHNAKVINIIAELKQEITNTLHILFGLQKLRNIKWKDEPDGGDPPIGKVIIRKAIWLTGISKLYI